MERRSEEKRKKNRYRTNKNAHQNNIFYCKRDALHADFGARPTAFNPRRGGGVGREETTRVCSEVVDAAVPSDGPQPPPQIRLRVINRYGRAYGILSSLPDVFREFSISGENNTRPWV